MTTSTLKKTELKYWKDEYLDLLEETIYKSKFWARALNKPMATPHADKETHLTSRATHMLLAAETIERIANKLGLNGKLARIAMLMHDAGHPFSAHQGEEIFDLIGRMFNTGFFHHNAKGVEVILNEDIVGRTIERIPDFKNDPEKRKEFEKNLREEFYCILDIVISHDGEAPSTEQQRKPIEYNTIEEAVISKLSKSNSENIYKFIAQTDEGKLAKIADVLAYVPTDIQDGFRLGIINNFNDDYLKLFGEMFAELDLCDGQTKPSTDEEKIAYAKEVIKKIRREKIAKLSQDCNLPENQEILKYAEEVIEKAKLLGINMDVTSKEDMKKLTKVLNEKISELEKFSNKNEQDIFKSKMKKLKMFVKRMIETDSSVVEAVTDKMKEYFEKDFIKTTINNGELGFSKTGAYLFDQIRLCNGKQFLGKTRWDYQLKGQPRAATKLVIDCARSLLRTGAIKDKLNDPEIRAIVEKRDKNAYDCMKPSYYPVPPKENEPKRRDIFTEDGKIIPEEQFQEKYGIMGMDTIIGAIDEEDPKKTNLYEMFGKVYEFLDGEYSTFAIRYVNVFNAIPNTVSKNVEFALSEGLDKILHHNEKTKFNKEIDPNNKRGIPYSEFLAPLQKNYYLLLRQKLIEKYGSIENARANQKHIIDALIEEERNRIEEKIAIQIAIDYISGMTDKSFDRTAIELGYMTQEEKDNSKRGSKPNDSIKKTMDRIAGAEERS